MPKSYREVLDKNGGSSHYWIYFSNNKLIHILFNFI
jgi:hypothetical protein